MGCLEFLSPPPEITLRACAHTTKTIHCTVPIARRGVVPEPIPYSSQRALNKKGKTTMLYTIAVVLILLWLLGFVSAYTMGGLIHVLLVIAVVVILVRVINGRKPI